MDAGYWIAACLGAMIGLAAWHLQADVYCKKPNPPLGWLMDWFYCNDAGFFSGLIRCALGVTFLLVAVVATMAMGASAFCGMLWVSRALYGVFYG